MLKQIQIYEGLDLKNITKRYGDKKALCDFSHRFSFQKITTIIGQSGSGKSTLLSIIAGLSIPTSGEVWLQGNNISGLAAEKRNVGMVFQNYALFPHLSVLENAAFGLRARGIKKQTRNNQALHYLNICKVSHLANRDVTTLSGGEGQRVALARALAIEPLILLMDEPLAALDAQLREYLREELYQLLSDLKLTTLYVTHDQSEAMAMGHELLILGAGLKLQAGEVKEVYREPISPSVAQFLGSANLLRAELKSENQRFGTFKFYRDNLGEPNTQNLKRLDTGLSQKENTIKDQIENTQTLQKQIIVDKAQIQGKRKQQSKTDEKSSETVMMEILIRPADICIKRVEESSSSIPLSNGSSINKSKENLSKTDEENESEDSHDSENSRTDPEISLLASLESVRFMGSFQRLSFRTLEMGSLLIADQHITQGNTQHTDSSLKLKSHWELFINPSSARFWWA